MSKVDISQLSTEQRNPLTMHLDEMSPIEMAIAINNEDKKVALAVEAELHTIATATEQIAKRFTRGGRIIYIGAGSSGRVGVMDAVELTPTYGVPPERAFGILAGGETAMRSAVEGAEDSRELALEDLRPVQLTPDDTLIAIAASGRTPYCLAALEHAKEKGALTVSVTCAKGSQMDQLADYGIAPMVGPEVVTGSTRMKSGTAQKMVANMLSTSVMVQCGKVCQNLMVNVQATNEKLVARATGIISQLTGLQREAAAKLFEQAGGSVAAAVVMQQAGVELATATKLLQQENGRVVHAVARAIQEEQAG